jgi:hypothetical protein
VSKFKITRQSGLSNAEVLIDLVRNKQPGDLLSYDDLSAALSAGTDREYGTRDVQSVVTGSEHKLAVTLSRALMNVPGEGYRIAPACEHQRIAGRKKERASKLLKRGITVLRNVRWDEMDTNQRQAHEGQLMISSAIASAMEGIEHRLARVESALAKAKS